MRALGTSEAFRTFGLGRFTKTAVSGNFVRNLLYTQAPPAGVTSHLPYLKPAVAQAAPQQVQDLLRKVYSRRFQPGINPGANNAYRRALIDVEAAQGKTAGLAAEALAGGKSLLRGALGKPSNLKRNLNLAGLGLIAAPSLHSLVSHDEDSPGVSNAKHLSDLAGLGLLIGTEFMPH